MSSSSESIEDVPPLVGPGSGAEPAGAEPLARPDAPSHASGLLADVSDGLAVPLGTLVSRAPLVVPPDATVAGAARAMRAAATSSALVAGDPPGIVTDSDLRNRVLADELAPDTPVHAVMSRPVTSLPVDAPVSSALVLMLEEDFLHVPVTSGDRIVGLISDRDLLRQQARSPLLLLGRVRTMDRLEAIEGYTRELGATAQLLWAGGVEPVRIARVLASLTDALTSRLLRLAEAELGPPPCPYAWLALGSEGRMEQVLLSDQDSALIYQADTVHARGWFAALAEQVVAGLLGAGFPPCPGGYVATNWCRPLPEWREVVRRWVEQPTPEALLEAEVFLDFRPVHGALSARPLDEILLSGAGRRQFLVQMARAATTFRPPLRMFGRIQTEDGLVDLKHRGTAAIVLLARLHALAARSTARSTLERLDAAATPGTLRRGRADALGDAFRFLMRLRLREQLRCLAEGLEPDNRVAVGDLPPLEQRWLREAFRAVAEVQQATATEFHTEG